MIWTGRNDGDGPEHARWHQLIRTDAPTGRHVTLLGFASDEGVRRNHGRVGAAQAPEALRRALAPMALHGALAQGTVALADLGDVHVEGEALEEGQSTMGARLAQALTTPDNLLTIALGGGHETAWASYLGLAGAGLTDGTRFGVLNLDAHFDLRRAERASSGTPFLQMADAERAAGRELRYAVAGIAEASNTGTLFDRARELGVRVLLDVDCTTEQVQRFVREFAANLDVLYLTIDLDVLPAANAPGVSAPAALGVAPQVVVAAVRAAAQTGKLRLLDVVELNPVHDIDARTARLAARLINDAVWEVAR